MLLKRTLLHVTTLESLILLVQAGKSWRSMKDGGTDQVENSYNRSYQDEDSSCVSKGKELWHHGTTVQYISHMQDIIN